jgi:hypothetical protein
MIMFFLLFIYSFIIFLYYLFFLFNYVFLLSFIFSFFNCFNFFFITYHNEQSIMSCFYYIYVNMNRWNIYIGIFLIVTWNTYTLKLGGGMIDDSKIIFGTGPTVSKNNNAVEGSYLFWAIWDWSTQPVVNDQRYLYMYIFLLLLLIVFSCRCSIHFFLFLCAYIFIFIFFLFSYLYFLFIFLLFFSV